MMTVRLFLSWSLFSLFLTGCHSNKNSHERAHFFDAPALLAKNPAIKPVVVIGGGVAGLTAANYLLQANIPCVLLEGAKPGGALAQSDSVRNWPGVLEAPGIKITESLKNQVSRNGATILSLSLAAITKDQHIFNLRVRDDAGNEQKMQALACIVAMGAEPNYLGIPGESGPQGYWGRGVSNCAVCDGALFKDKVVAVVGGGDSAILEAAYLAGLAKQVYVLVRRDVLRARDMRKVTMVQALSNVKFMYDASVTAVYGDGKIVTSIDVMNNKTKTIKKLGVDGLFLAIGATPNTKLFSKLVDLDAAGYIILCKGQESSVPGLFAAGDICDPLTKQAVTSSAMGCKAALEVKEYLEHVGYIPAVLAVSGGGVVQEDPSIHLAVLGTQGERVRPHPLVVSDSDPEFNEGEESYRTMGTIKTSNEKKHEAGVLEIASLEHAQQVLHDAGNKLVVVDVYGSYCVPCQKMAPIVEAVAQQYPAVRVTKLNVAGGVIDVAGFVRIVGTEEITGVPTFLFIKQGKAVARHVGMMSQDAFAKLVDKNK